MMEEMKLVVKGRWELECRVNFFKQHFLVFFDSQDPDAGIQIIGSVFVKFHACSLVSIESLMENLKPVVLENSVFEYRENS